MSLVSIIGPRPNLFDLQGVAGNERLEVRQPILTDGDLEKIRSISDIADSQFMSRTLDTTFHAGLGGAGLIEAVRHVLVDAIHLGIGLTGIAALAAALLVRRISHIRFGRPAGSAKSG